MNEFEKQFLESNFTKEILVPIMLVVGLIIALVVAAR
jgi:hypothetical protein